MTTVNSNNDLRIEATTKRIRAEIENLKYDRDLIIQQKESFPYGFLNREYLNRKLAEIDEKIMHLQKKLEQYKQTTTDASLLPPIVSILFMAADPTDSSRLRLGEEFREIQEKLQLARMREHFKLYQRMSVRPTDISQALLDVQPQIVHFSGHGTSAGALCFENQWGKTHPISPDAIAALFEQFVGQVKCVLLNACYSASQAKAIAKHVDYVIGMVRAVGDKAAIAFAIGFYQALGAGRTFEEAYKLGVVQIQLQSIPGHLTPVLIKRY